MTEKRFIELAMKLRPTAKEWREKVKKAIASGCLKSFDDMQDNFRDVYPLAAAIAMGYVDRYLNGSSYEETRKQARRECKNIMKFI